MGFLVWMLVYGTLYGNTSKLSHGFNAKGEQCGVTEAVQDKPLLYFCPTILSVGGEGVNTKDPICVGVCPVAGDQVSECSVTKAYQTEVHSRYCMPSGSTNAEVRRELSESMRSFGSTVTDVLIKIQRAWTVLLMIVVVAMVMGYIFLFMLKNLAKCFIYICAVVGFLAFAALGFILWSKSASDDGSFQMAFKVGAILSWCASCGVLLLVSCCGQAVELSTACMSQAAHVIWQMPLLLGAPLFKAILKITVFAFLCAGFVHLLSTGEITGVGRDRHIEYTEQQKGYLWGYAFVSLWVLSFITALYEFAIAYATSQYYVAHTEEGTKDVSPFAACEGVYIGVRYHTGSLALGSCIVTIFELRRYSRGWSSLAATTQPQMQRHSWHRSSSWITQGRSAQVTAQSLQCIQRKLLVSSRSCSRRLTEKLARMQRPTHSTQRLARSSQLRCGHAR
eukprot:TRINITY_DN18396_c1_g1_i1.p1 TRINITY_DN18396_c1_g1~~TRINITY_DN18396_c1_g1_i1.p1  ORF type:complete len:513 (+),score=61.54 TRINITY_DN18396_c1_g1_i1:192-1541(+)